MYGFWAILFTVSIKHTCNLHSAIEITAVVSPVPPPGHPCQQRTALKLGNFIYVHFIYFQVCPQFPIGKE